MLLPAIVLIIGVTLLFIMLSAPDGADSARVEQAAYPFPCLYLPVIKQEAIDAGQIETEPSHIAPAATYPPPGGPCGQRLPKWLHMPIIRR
jgi:hypothetical protein